MVPGVYIIGRLFLRYRENRVSCVVSEMRPYMMTRLRGCNEFFFHFLPVLGLVLGVFALAGPTWEKYVDEQPERQTISLVINMPETCLASDMAQMKVAVYHLLDFLQDSLRGERVSLSVQSGSSHLLLPYTDDYRLVRTYTKFIEPGIMPVRGDDLESIASVVLPPETTSFHTVIYVTPSMSVEKAGRWNDLKLSSGYKVALVMGKNDATKFADIIHVGVNNEGIRTVEMLRKQKAGEKIREAALRDSTRWKDKGYILCIPVTLLLLPLFLRSRQSVFMLFSLLSLTSCTYTGKMWNDAQVNFYLQKGDTSRAINVSNDPFRRGILWGMLKEYGNASGEFAQDTTCEALYNRGLSVYRGGYFLEARSILKEVEKKKPEWEFVREDLRVIEKLIASGVVESLMQEKRNGNDEFDSFEKDSDEKEYGDEIELWADKLENETPDKMNYSSSKALKKSEVLFRQIENDPKEFIRRRLEYEYTSSK